MDSDSAEATISVNSGEERPMTFELLALRLPITRADAQGFVESDGYVAIEAVDTSAPHGGRRDALGGTAWLRRNAFGDDGISSDSGEQYGVEGGA